MVKNTSPLEKWECEQFAKVLDAIGVYYTHIPHGTFAGNYSVINKNKKIGLRPGIPDYVVCWPYGISGPKTIFIEMKRQIMSYPDLEQKEWIKTLNYHGSPSYWCKGYKKALEVLQQNTDSKGGEAAVWKYLDNEINNGLKGLEI